MDRLIVTPDFGAGQIDGQATQEHALLESGVARATQKGLHTGCEYDRGKRLA